MSQPDRWFHEDACAILQKKLSQKLVDDPSCSLPEQDIQDVEVAFSLATEGSVLKLQIRYPFLISVLRYGSQDLLERVWCGLPLQLKVDVEDAVLHVAVDANSLGDDEAARRRVVLLLASTRVWLLIGPLVERLRWLRGITDAAEARASSAPAGARASIIAAALPSEQVPPILELQVRPAETCWIVPKADRVLVIISVHVDDEVEVALGRAFCQEFAEASRRPSDGSPPCSFNEPKDLPNDLRNMPLKTPAPSVGFLTLSITDQHVRGASDDRLHALARPAMTLRCFFQFHLKKAKCYVHSRLRRQLDGWQHQLNLARRPSRRAQEKRRLVTGKEFVPKVA